MKKAIIAVFLVLLSGAPAYAESEEATEGTIFTLWPLIDYRTSPRENYSNLSLLGPLFKLQYKGDQRDLAVRPLFYRVTDESADTSETDYLYPLASTKDEPNTRIIEVLELYQKKIYRRQEEKPEKSTSLFPFYFRGTSRKYGDYRALFPIYGTIYERFSRDEIHFTLFPLYSRTVKKGTTNRNYLYPFFSLTEGPGGESGFQVWPLYGQASRPGDYQKRFVVWPFYITEKSGLSTDNPSEKLYVFPFYVATDSRTRTSRHHPWPFLGHTKDEALKLEEWDYLWPFWYTVRGEKENVDSYLPFYRRAERGENLKYWYMWPIYSHSLLDSAHWKEDRRRILFWLYSDTLETWPKDGATRRKVALWPFFMYKSEPRGVRRFSFPAPVEPIFDREGIERCWAPLWRIYQRKWNDGGDVAESFLWNLYWREKRGQETAFEVFPLLRYRSDQQEKEFKLLKGILGYERHQGKKRIRLLWLPIPIGGDPAPSAVEEPVTGESGDRNS